MIYEVISPRISHGKRVNKREYFFNKTFGSLQDTDSYCKPYKKQKRLIFARLAIK